MVKKNDYELAKDFSECVERIHKEAEDKMARCRAAYELIKTMKPLLPTGWKAAYETWGSLTFSRAGEHRDPVTNEVEKHSPVEFRTVCQHVERITGLKLQRKFSDWSEPSLNANVWIHDGNYTVNVRLGSPNCKITYEEKEIPAHTEKKAIVPDACLGKQAS